MKQSLSIRVERLERVVTEELLRREKSEKYTHNMLEDLKTQMRDGFEGDVKTDREMEDRLAEALKEDRLENNRRLSRIEIAMATALGGLLVIAWMLNHAASSILRLLSPG